MRIFNRLLLFLGGISLFSLSCSVNKLTLDQRLAQDKFTITKSDEGINSIVVNYYDSASYYDSPYQRYMMTNTDKPDGQFNVYDESGLLRRTLYYKNHLREGKDTWYYTDGQIMQEKMFVHDKYVSYKTYYPKRFLLDTQLTDTLGVKRHWDEEGNLIYEKNYHTGEYKEWYTNGKVHIRGLECPAECFQLQGPWYFYNPAGELEQIMFYHGVDDADAWDSIYHYQGDKIMSIDRIKNK
ncbi:MAG: toxin-antitoxin system YwqK family antitoxin [Bacteroidia bacterium]